MAAIIYYPPATDTLKFLWISLVLTSLPTHVTLNRIIGYALEETFSGEIPWSKPLTFLHLITEQIGGIFRVLNAPTTYLQNSKIVTHYRDIMVVATDEFVDKCQTLLLFIPSDNCMPTESNILNCFIDPLQSTCELTVRPFALVCTTILVVLKSLIAIIAVSQHSYFRGRVFNCLGDMITLGARHSHCSASRTVPWKSPECSQPALQNSRCAGVVRLANGT